MKKIIDTHLHTWDIDKLDYYWLKNDTSILAKTYLLDEVHSQIADAGVTAAVLVQATNSLDETDWFLQLATQYKWVLGAVVWLPFNNPAAFNKAIETYSSNPYFKGVRHQIHDEADDDWLLQLNVIDSLKELAKQNIPYDLVGTKPAHIKTLLKVAEKIPDLKLVFDHLNQPPFTNKTAWKQWAELMSEAAKNPHVYAKVSGLGTATSKPFEWTAEDIKPAVELVLKEFGVYRIFCGSDWPVCLLAGSYEYTWHQYQLLLDSLLNEAAQQKVYVSNAEKFYNLH
jgi:L-fuconolactonase